MRIKVTHTDSFLIFQSGKGETKNTSYSTVHVLTVYCLISDYISIMHVQEVFCGTVSVPRTLSVLCVAVLVTLVRSTHQRWWLYGCQCSNWESRDSVREVVMSSYRGLFVGRDDLSKLPVVKLHKNPGEANLQSYVANTLPHINSFINPGCCHTQVQSLL